MTQLRRLILGGLLTFGLTCPALASATPWTLSAPTTISYSNADAPSAQLQLVGCSAPGTCTAIGTNAPFSDAQLVNTGSETTSMVSAQEVNGIWQPATVVSSVSITSTQSNLSNGVDGTLSLGGMACTSAGTCIATGDFSSYTFTSSTAETSEELFYVTQQGGVWGSPQSMAFPANAIDLPNNTTPSGPPGDVACASAAHCVALGKYSTSLSGSDSMAAVGSVSGFGSYAETDPSVETTGVACVPQSTTCTALGEVFVGGYDELAIQTETRGSWLPPQTITSGTGDNGEGTLPEGNAIVCPAAGDCEVGGDYPSTYATEDLFTMQETGGTWGTPQGIGDGESPEGGFISGDMACISVGNCIWGGQSEETQGSGPNTLYFKQAIVAEQTNGTWSGFEFSPMPAAAEQPPNSDSASERVSCAGTRCDVVGFYITETPPPNATGTFVPYAFSTMQGSLYKVSGSVSTSSACGCGGVPIADGGVLVSGKSSDGSAVSQTAVTDANGDWSVMVPSGSYKAGPSLDGSTFADLPSFDPENRSITVNGTDVPDQNFVTCVLEPAGSSSAPDARPAGDPSAGAAAVAPAKQCVSQYTITLKASIPQAKIVDPSLEAHYRLDPTATNPGFHTTDYWITKRLRKQKLGRQLASLPTFPACNDDFSPAQVKELTLSGASIKWFSEIVGKAQLGSAKVTFAWNQTTGKVQYVSGPTYVTGQMTRRWRWDLEAPHEKPELGTCEVSEPVTVLLAPVLSSAEGAHGLMSPQDFTVIAAWNFPFEPAGLKIDSADTTAAQSVLNVAREASEYIESHPAAKFFYEVGWMLAEATVVGKGLHGLKAFSLAKTAAFFGGEAPKLAAEAISTGINLAHKLHNVKDAGEALAILAGLFAEESSGYPWISAVVRGHFHTTPTDYGKIEGAHDVYATGQVPSWTTLAVSAATTKFPNISMTIARTAAQNPNPNIETYSGILPWLTNAGLSNAGNLFLTNSGSMGFGVNPKYQINHNDTEYPFGQDGVERLLDEFKPMQVIPQTIREYKAPVSEETFGKEQSLAPAPGCSDTLKNPQPTTEHTICWQFTDGVA